MLLPGQQLLGATGHATSPDGRSLLTAQDDGNVCLYVSGTPVWCSGQNLHLDRCIPF